ncbi:MAG: transposase [Chloroflexi bacterium]|nr:transposase [Chloroflexota bacterium]
MAQYFRPRLARLPNVLLVGAILCPGKRTVTSVLRVMGLRGDGNFARYHHVLNRARWSSLQLSRTLLFLLLRYLDV